MSLLEAIGLVEYSLMIDRKDSFTRNETVSEETNLITIGRSDDSKSYSKFSSQCFVAGEG